MSKELIENYEDRKPGTGDYTGFCWRCGSSNLWDDMTIYGCEDCGMMRSNEVPQLIQTK